MEYSVDDLVGHALAGQFTEIADRFFDRHGDRVEGHADLERCQRLARAVKGFLHKTALAFVIDQRLGRIEVLDSADALNRGDQLPDAVAVFSRHADDVAEVRFDLVRVDHWRQIGFIEYGDRGGCADLGDQLPVLVGQRLRPVEHTEDQRSGVQAVLRLVHADALDLVVGAVDARGIGQVEDEIIEADGFLHHVARRTRDRGDDAFVIAGEKIHQGAFADVRLADDGGVDAVAQQSAVIIALDNAVKLRQGVIQRAG